MNQKVDYIIPECYVDTNLIETLVGSFGCNHQKGCNQVVNSMKEKYSNNFVVGIIDADKRKPNYLSDFFEVGSSEHLTLLRHNNLPHFIILICPAVDCFILSCAQKGNFNLSDFGLPSALKDFTKQTKNIKSNTDIRFKKLFKAMNEVEEIRLLKTIIEYLVEKTYKADDNDLKTYFNQNNSLPEDIEKESI